MFRVEKFSFDVTQNGESTPVIDYISDSRYNYLFQTGILTDFRGMITSTEINEELPPQIYPDKISIFPEIVVIPSGISSQVSATLGSEDPDITITESLVLWRSSDERVATVDENGLITSVSEGETTIVATTVNGLTASSRVIVEDFTFSFQGEDGNSVATVTGYHGSRTSIEIPSEAINHEKGWTLPSPVTIVGFAAFSSLNLDAIIIPNSITEIRTMTFDDNNLTTLEISESVDSLGAASMTSNRLLEEITFRGEVRSLGLGIFGGNNLLRVIVEEESLDFYKNRFVSSVMMNSHGDVFLGVRDSRYSTDTEFMNDIMVGESIHFEAITKNRYMWRGDIWEETSSNVQWYKNSLPVTNEANPIFRIPSVQETNSGIYYAIVDGTQLENLIVTVNPPINPPIPPINPNNPDLEVPENPNAGQLSIRYVSALNFGEIAVMNHKQNIFALPSQDNLGIDIPNMITIQDMRPDNQRDGWTLTVSQREDLLNGAQLTMNPYADENKVAELNLNFLELPLVLNNEKQAFFWVNAGNSAGIVSFGMDHPEGDGVKLTLPSGVGIGTYKTNLDWELATGP